MSARTSFPSIFLDRCAGVARGASKNNFQSTVRSRGTPPESQQIRKERHGIGEQIQLITVANLSVAVAISRISKFERDESAMLRTKPLRAFVKDLIYKRLSDKRRQKLVKNYPLIVPA